VILRDATETINNSEWIFVFFKEQKPVSLQKKQNTGEFFNGFFSTLIVFQSLL